MTRTNNPAHAREDTYPRKLEIGVLYGFRALMVLAVVNYHIWQQSWLSQRVSLLGLSTDFDFFTRSSYLFVDGMILLSGFLLYLPDARQTLEGTPVPKTGRFYLNRLLRIVPSDLAAVLLALVCFALPQGAYVTSGAMAKDVAAHLTFTFLFWPETYLYTPLNAALWTIAVEMQFYLLFPWRGAFCPGYGHAYQPDARVSGRICPGYAGGNGLSAHAARLGAHAACPAARAQLGMRGGICGGCGRGAGHSSGAIDGQRGRAAGVASVADGDAPAPDAGFAGSHAVRGAYAPRFAKGAG